MTHWDWMNEHWWVGFWLWFWGMCFGVSAIHGVFKSIAVMFHGWPPAKIVNRYEPKEVRDIKEVP